jgi:hypothetical protein
MREPGGMGTGVEPWARLIDEHRRNVERLEAEQPPPPSRWSLPLGAAVPVLALAAALLWRDPMIMVAAAMCFVLLLPIGLAFLFVERLQPVALGVLLGAGGSLFTAQALLL